MPANRRAIQERCFTVPDGATLIGFTDGLVERRGEHLDISLERLRQAAPGGPRRGRSRRGPTRPPGIGPDPRGCGGRRGYPGTALVELNGAPGHPATISVSEPETGALQVTMGGEYDIGGS